MVCRAATACDRNWQGVLGIGKYAVGCAAATYMERRRDRLCVVSVMCAHITESTIQDEVRVACGKALLPAPGSVPISAALRSKEEVLIFFAKVSAGLAQSGTFKLLLEDLFAHPGLRVLITTEAAGPLAVTPVLECSVPLGPLDDDSSLTLLKHHWSGHIPLQNCQKGDMRSAIRATKGNPSQLISLAQGGTLYRAVDLKQLDASAPYLHISLRPPPVVLDLSPTSCLHVLSQKLEAFKWIGRQPDSGEQSLWRRNGAGEPVHIRADLDTGDICTDLPGRGCFCLVWCALGCGWDQPPAECRPCLSLPKLETLMSSPSRPRILVVALRYGARKVSREDSNQTNRHRYHCCLTE